MAVRSAGTHRPLPPAARPAEPAAPAPPLELRLVRRSLLLLAIVVPLMAALVGFGAQQGGAPNWPAPPLEVPERGRILAADGSILAEGPVGARRYPQAQLAAHVVGFSGRVQPDGRYGLEGVEYTQDAALQAGKDVRLTIDPTLQAAAERHLRDTVREHGAESGSVVMLEADSGRVLASANHPTFDPNRQGDYPRNALINRAFRTPYEPGSVIKPFVVSALLQNGRLAPDERVDAEPTLRVGDQTFRDVSRHPDELPVRDVLRYSSNTAMLHLTERLRPQELHAWLKAFGFDRTLPMEGAYTRSGSLNPWRDWVPQDQASVTIGQSMSVTPLQLAAGYSVFANDGAYVPPRLLEDAPDATPHRVLATEVARSVRGMLTYTVENSGLRNSAVPGVRTAGKTGTADVYSAAHGTYPDGWYTLTFAGMFPADDPRMVMVVTLHKPDPDATSTYVAAPLFRAIGSEAVAHWGLAPEPERRAEAP